MRLITVVYLWQHVLHPFRFGEVVAWRGCVLCASSGWGATRAEGGRGTLWQRWSHGPSEGARGPLVIKAVRGRKKEGTEGRGRMGDRNRERGREDGRAKDTINCCFKKRTDKCGLTFIRSSAQLNQKLRLISPPINYKRIKRLKHRRELKSTKKKKYHEAKKRDDEKKKGKKGNCFCKQCSVWVAYVV